MWQAVHLKDVVGKSSPLDVKDFRAHHAGWSSGEQAAPWTTWRLKFF